MAGDVNDNRVPKDRDKLVDSKYNRKEIGFFQKTTRTEIVRKERTRDAQSPGSSFGQNIVKYLSMANANKSQGCLGNKQLKNLLD